MPRWWRRRTRARRRLRRPMTLSTPSTRAERSLRPSLLSRAPQASSRSPCSECSMKTRNPMTATPLIKPSPRHSLPLSRVTPNPFFYDDGQTELVRLKQSAVSGGLEWRAELLRVLPSQQCGQDGDSRGKTDSLGMNFEQLQLTVNGSRVDWPTFHALHCLLIQLFIIYSSKAQVYDFLGRTS